jgi:hypothetical protein
MTKGRTGLALVALTLCGGCSSLWFEPTPNWWSEGGRLCAANRDTLHDWDRPAPHACAQTLAEAGAPVETLAAGGW